LRKKDIEGVRLREFVPEGARPRAARPPGPLAAAGKEAIMSDVPAAEVWVCVEEISEACCWREREVVGSR
jgi:hypothetical protein